MASQRLGQFYEGFASWRRSLAKAAPEAQLIIFNNAVVEVVGYVRKGLDRAVAADELADMAASIGIVDADLVQAVIAEQFARIERINGPDGGRLGAGEEEDAADADMVPDDWSDLDYSAVDLNKAAEKFDRARERREQQKLRRRDNGRVALAVEVEVEVEAQWLDDFLRDLQPPDYLIDGLLQRRFIYSMTGKTASGKTAVALYLCICVALGWPLGTLVVTQGNVLYLAGENPDDIGYRCLALRQQLDCEEVPLPMMIVPKRFVLSRALPSLHRLAQSVGGFALVVVDTSAAFFEGDEVNSNTQQGDHARMLRQLTTLPGGPTVLVCTHPVKNAADDNLLPLGAGAFLNEMDANLTTKLDGVAIELYWQGKIRGPDFAPINFELVAGVTHERLKTASGRPFKTAIARHLSQAGREDMEIASTGNAQLLLAEVKRSPKATQRDYARTLGWTFGSSGEPDHPKVGRLLKRLKKEGLVARELGAWVLREKAEKHLENQLLQSAPRFSAGA